MEAANATSSTAAMVPYLIKVQDEVIDLRTLLNDLVTSTATTVRNGGGRGTSSWNFGADDDHADVVRMVVFGASAGDNGSGGDVEQLAGLPAEMDDLMTVTDKEEEDRELFLFITYGILLTFIGLLGLAGNALSIVVLSRPQMRSSINCCLIGLPMDRSFRFCILLTLGVMIPATFMVVPLYLRHQVFAGYHMAVSSSDWRHLDQRVSTVWCESLKVRMNTTFNAFLLRGDLPHFENSTRTYWTTKHFNLRSEEREYWGFYLPKGSVLTLAMCARYDGAKVYVFKGKRNMKKCVKKEDDSYEDEGTLSDEDDDYLTDDDMYDTDGEESSYSSSEEDFTRECTGALFNQSLTPTALCDSPASWRPKDVLTYTASSSDYYYALFSSLNNIFVNKVHTKISLQKPVYSVADALGACMNTTECNLPFQFGEPEYVVLEVPNRDDWLADIGHVSCEPRTMLYFPFYLGVPISILFFAFRGSK